MDRASRCGTLPVRTVLAAFLVFAAGCGRPAAGPREASLLPDGRIEWRAEGAGLILVPRGLSVTRKARLTNRTGTALRNLAARTSCPSCSSAHAAAEGLSDGEDGWLVTVRPAPKSGGACIDTLRVGDDERDRLDVRLEVDVEDDTRAVE
jgi:hypothetical protein